MFSIGFGKYLLYGLLSTFHRTRRSNFLQKILHLNSQYCAEYRLVFLSFVSDPNFSVERGFLLKRECGLGPCSFDDNMASRGLGWDGCDRTKDAFFCVSCCKGNGCNKSSSSSPEEGPRLVVVAVCLLAVIMLEIFKGFQPPYLPDKERL